jgi:uncharacterized membrane protein
MKWKMYLIGLILLLTLISISNLASADPDDNDVAPCCETVGGGLSILEIVFIIGGIIAVVVILYMLYRTQAPKDGI